MPVMKKLMLKRPSAKALAGPKKKDEKKGKSDQKKGLDLMADLKQGQSMGRNAAQAIVDKLKSLKKKDPEHQGLALYRECNTNEEKRRFGMRLHIDREGAFCKAKENEGIKGNRRASVTAGLMSIWEIADIEKIPWKPDCPATMDLLASLVADLDGQPHPNKRLFEQGFMVYPYQKKGHLVTTLDRYKEVHTEISVATDAKGVESAKECFDKMPDHEVGNKNIWINIKMLQINKPII